MLDLDALHAALRASTDLNVARDDLFPLPAKGVAHDHVRLGDSGWLARVPRFNQWGLAPDEALAYEAAAFDRAAPSGHTPALFGTLPTGAGVPRGALLVQYIDGRPPVLPDELPALAQALAALHRLPLPDVRAPLQVHDDPVSATLKVIETQAAHLPRAGLDPAAQAAITEELDAARALAQATDRPQLCLVGTDTHPGNLLIDPAGRAWLVDLEKALYGAAAIDLAHATLATSTGWDPDVAARLGRAEIASFYAAYLALLPAAAADALRPWLLPLRRLTWLRTITWFARWQADWSDSKGTAERDPALAAHIERFVAASLSPEGVEAVRAEWLGPMPLDLDKT